MLIAAPIVTGENFLRAGNIVVREKGLDAWLIWLTTRGRVQVIHPNGRTDSGPSEVFLIAPKVRQEYGLFDQEGTWGCIWAVFQPRAYWKNWLQWPELAPGTMRLRLKPGNVGLVRTVLRNMHHAARSTVRQRHDLALCHLEEALLLCDQVNPLSNEPALDARVQQALEYLRREPELANAPRKLAAAAGLSAPHLLRLFRQQMGETPRRFVERHRFERAVELLRFTGLRVSEIAGELGYEDSLYFSARFKKEFGVGPREFRRKGG